MKRGTFRQLSYQEKLDRLRVKRGKKPSRIARLKAERKTKEWNATRRKLKREFAAAGITSCELKYEGCRRDDLLSFAHGRKRRHLQDGELHGLTILSCVPCHDKIEFLPAEAMLSIVRDTIAKRAA